MTEPSMPKMSDADYQRILGALAEAGVRLPRPCPECGRGQQSLQPRYIVALLTGEMKQFQPQTMSHAAFLVTAICGHCGFASWFNPTIPLRMSRPQA